MIHLQMIREFALRDMIVMLKRKEEKERIEIQVNRDDFTNDVNDEYVLMNDFHIKTIKSSKSQRQTISSYTRSLE